MRRAVVVHPKAELGDANVNIFVAALGFESRATHATKVWRKDAERGLAIAFPQRDRHSYLENRAFFLRERFEVCDYRAGALVHKLHSYVREFSDRPGVSSIKMAVDISSMSRPMMAEVVAGLGSVEFEGPVDVTFLYSPAKFVAPNHDDAPVVLSEPVIPEFAGWTTAPERPVTALIGLGYEYGQAIGTLEYLEPQVAWAFLPTGEDPRYDRELASSNADLFELLSEERIVRYRLDNPFSYFQTIENLCFGLIQRSRPVIVPFGPKLFALVCLLTAQIHKPHLTVWRVSGDQTVDPIDREASGKLITLKVSFVPDQE